MTPNPLNQLANLGQTIWYDNVQRSLLLNGEIASKIQERDRFKELQGKGARYQRPLWASTGVKIPKYHDTMYVEGLIGSHTVKSMPPATMVAFKDHSRASGATIKQYVDEILERLCIFEIDYNSLTEILQEQGVGAFIDSFNALQNTLDAKRSQLKAEILMGSVCQI